MGHRGGHGHGHLAAGPSRVLVVDNGAGYIKLGLAGEDGPRMVFPNCTAKAKGERQVLVGDMLLEARHISGLTVRRPFDRGFLVNWDVEKDIWARAFKTLNASLSAASNSSRPQQYHPHSASALEPASTGLLLTEPVFNFPSIQATTEEIVFEEFGFHSYFAAPAPWFALQHTLATTPLTSSSQQHLGVQAGAAAEGSWPGEVHPSTAAAIAAGAGVVVDAGFSGCTAVPFFEGRLLSGGLRRLNLGGKALTNLLKEMVSYRSLNMNEEVVLMEHVKEELCWVSQDVLSDLKRAQVGPLSPHRREYVLPDGVHNLRGYVRPTSTLSSSAAAALASAKEKGVRLGPWPPPKDLEPEEGADQGDGKQQQQQEEQQQQGSKKGPVVQDQVLTLNNELFMVPEALFRPSDIGLPQVGVAELVSQAVSACHAAFAPLLYANVVLTGGCCRLPGFRERFEAELRSLAPEDYHLGVSCPEDPELVAWRGASQFAASGQYSLGAITKADYEERGAGGVGRR